MKRRKYFNLNRNLLYKEYWINNKSLKEIGLEYNLKSPKYIFSSLNIPKRDSKTATKIAMNKEGISEKISVKVKEALKKPEVQLHIIEAIKKRIISKVERNCQCGCNKKFMCKINSKQRFIHGHGGKKFYKDQIPWNKNKSYEFDNSSLLEWVKRHGAWNKGIKFDAIRREKNGNWQNGKSFEEYGAEFDNALKEQVRFRDKYACQLCGCSQVENGRQMSVHHIDYNKRNNDINNLVALCIGCHTKIHKNRIMEFHNV